MRAIATMILGRIASHLNKDAARRLTVSALVAVLAFSALPNGIFVGTRALAAWDLGALCFLLLAYSLIAGATADQTGRNAQRQDQSGPILLGLAVIATSASLFAIGFALQHTKGLASLARGWLLTLSGITVACSWLMTHTTFALHYAHRYYGDRYEPTGQADKGLEFPGGAMPDYMDFVYFSFVIGMTSQVSDVQITSRPMRRLAWLHGMLSFAFNTGILALTINVVATLL
jgi:uncharacterized membrane protein